MWVPDTMSACVAFLGVPKHLHSDEIVVKGTAFFVEVPSEQAPTTRRYQYFITAQHCLDIAGELPLSIRLNSWDQGAIDIPLSEQIEWVHHPDDGKPDALRVDVVVREWKAAEDLYDCSCLSY